MSVLEVTCDGIAVHTNGHSGVVLHRAGSTIVSGIHSARPTIVVEGADVVSDTQHCTVTVHICAWHAVNTLINGDDNDDDDGDDVCVGCLPGRVQL